MDKKDSGQLMEKVFASLYNMMIPSSLDENEPSTKLLSIMLPGITLGEELNSDKTKGKELLNLIVDRIPKIAKNYVDSGKKVSLEYQKILGAITPEDDARDTEEKEAYKSAQELLFKGKSYTPLYQTYLEKQEVYEKAQNAYLTEKNKADPLEEELTRLKNEAKTALMNWIASGKNDVDEALNIMTRYRAFTPSSIFGNAIFEYELHKSESGMDTKFVPEKWAENPETLSWETITIHEKETADHVHKDVSSIASSFSARFSAGLWGGEASGSYKKDLEKVQNESKVEEFGMRFKVARVDILRDWFNGGLIDYPNVYVRGVGKNGICSGTLEEGHDCSFPLLPTALLIAKEINVYNNFSASEQEYIKQSSEWSAQAKVSYGPFSIGNDTEMKDLSEDEKKEGFTASGKIEIGKKPQIIGVISTVMTPGFPQMEEPKTPNKKMLKNRHMTEPSTMERMTTKALIKRDNYSKVDEKLMKEILG